jgi:hypothetical protein
VSDALCNVDSCVGRTILSNRDEVVDVKSEL